MAFCPTVSETKSENYTCKRDNKLPGPFHIQVPPSLRLKIELSSTEKSLTFLCDNQSFQVSFLLLLKRILMLHCKVFHQISIVLEESTEMLIWNMFDHCLGPVYRLFWSSKLQTGSRIFARNFHLLQCSFWPLLVSEK